jgi:endonuclease/exonuclease/phosphatase family metal-dependent hydrolase
MPTLSVATINLRLNADRWPERRHLLVSQLLEAAPHLISLQEIALPIRQGQWLRHELNMRLSGKPDKPYQLIQRRKHHLIKGYYEGVGILTRLPIRYRDSLPLGYGGRVALRANLELPDRQTLDFVTTHLHHMPIDKEARLEQVMKLTGWLGSRRRIPNQIIAGDFNEAPNGAAIAYVKQGFRSAYEQVHGHEPLATFPTALITPFQLDEEDPDIWAACLDYIFVSSAVRITAVSLFCHHPDPDDDTLYPSDHVGLLATIEI